MCEQGAEKSDLDSLLCAASLPRVDLSKLLRLRSLFPHEDVGELRHPSLAIMHQRAWLGQAILLWADCPQFTGRISPEPTSSNKTAMCFHWPRTSWVASARCGSSRHPPPLLSPHHQELSRLSFGPDTLTSSRFLNCPTQPFALLFLGSAALLLLALVFGLNPVTSWEVDPPS